MRLMKLKNLEHLKIVQFQGHFKQEDDIKFENVIIKDPLRISKESYPESLSLIGLIVLEKNKLENLRPNR